MGLQSALDMTTWQPKHPESTFGSVEKSEQPNDASAHKREASLRHAPEFEFDNLPPEKFEESFSDIEKKISQKMQSYENRQNQRCERAQQTDMTMRHIREQKDGFDNIVQNFDYIREVVRKYMRLDISSGYKHAYDQKQKDKICQKFEQKTAINLQTERIIESLQQQMLSQTALGSSAGPSEKECPSEIVKYKAQIYDL